MKGKIGFKERCHIQRLKEEKKHYAKKKAWLEENKPTEVKTDG